MTSTVSRYVRDRVRRWRTGSTEGQREVLGVLLICVACAFVASVIDYDTVPLTSYFVWLIVGMLLLRFWFLAAMTTCTAAAAVTAMLLDGPVTGPRAAALLTLGVAVALILYQSSRQRSGLPSPLSEALLSELRERLQSQSALPALPDGWHTETAMIASDGVGYAGDFLVADLDEQRRRLELILVDVCGKGLGAGPQALQFAGALGGLIGSLPPGDLMQAANRFLLRRGLDDSFATAVHVALDLDDGRYSITSAGHPPALRWEATADVWHIDNARGMAIGIERDPELMVSEGVLCVGDALLFYTDGVIESPTSDLDSGIDWLRGVARGAIRDGGPVGSAQRIIEQVERGDDDRAVLVLSRTGPAAGASTARG
ncbi:PP2C family protein-serine/threonine phosphatase [Nocardioides sp. cx-173]|uniref:PP2C family protein-serine/threonine phosphatase n=1 Tax=Nocardioides sp. cx-173 TaxID=2898796 RepID=UPI001E53026E|nr:PP2C family protein-serine/threonine phosphatase [Nocardioides sp. cx-173]MCD4525810.1 serine/threonine-protein phosphatase [Nocardioides sp. cx-173]UGB39965.1 serine/threonine-protein phosphatase [Nocardioides sp. cx-173]